MTQEVARNFKEVALLPLVSFPDLRVFLSDLSTSN